MNTTAKIVLNRETLEALFPEGSEARVELQKSIVYEFAKKLILSDQSRVVHEVKAQVDGALAGTYGSYHERVKTEVAGYLNEIKLNRTKPLPAEFVEGLRTEMRREIQEAALGASAVIRERFKEQVTEFKAREMNRLVTETLRAVSVELQQLCCDAAELAMREKLSESLNKLLQQDPTNG